MLSAVSRAACRASVTVARTQARTFIVPTVARRADFVQDLYLKALSNYKPATISASDAEGHVHKFTLPKAPVSPEEADLASSLKEYESMAVDIEGSDAPVSADGSAIVEDWLVEEPEEEEVAHH